MISIGKHIDEFDIAQEVRLERRVHKGSFLLLEGSTDIKRFTPLIDNDQCSVVNCYGRRNAIGAIKLLYDDGFPGALGVVDADFDRVTGRLEGHEGLVYSEAHDFDLDWARPGVVARYLAEVGDAEKCELHGTATEVIEKIMSGLKPISVAKLLNRMRRIGYRLSNIEITTCFLNFQVDVDRYVALVLSDGGISNHERAVLKAEIERASRREYDLHQITNGHDFHRALGVCLRGDLGSRRDVHTWGSEVEMHLRLTFSDEDFKNTTVYCSIAKWVRDNHPYLILHPRFT